MDPGSNQAGVVNRTRAMEALSPWLNHPRRTIILVEVLVLLAAALLLLQLILGICRRRWHNSFTKYGLQVCNGIMFPLTVYTLGNMQSSPVKNSLYPTWAGFLIMASAGTTAVRKYDFHDSFYSKYMQVGWEYLRDSFYASMFFVLLDPNPRTFNLKKAWDQRGHKKNPRASSTCVSALVSVVALTKLYESTFLVVVGYKKKQSLSKSHLTRVLTKLFGSTFLVLFSGYKTKERHLTQVAEHDSDPQSMKGYKYVVCSRPFGGRITIDQIWDSCGNSTLKDLCLSYALSQLLQNQRYFGLVCAETSHLKDYDFVFKNLLPPQGDFQRAFKVIEVELGFCYDIFFTKYYYTFVLTNSLPVPFIQCSLNLLKIILILMVGVIAIRKQLVLETPDPIIEVHISEADYIITLLLLIVALVVELVQAAFYLASNWAQVSLACRHVKKRWFESNAYIFGKIIALLRWVKISQKLRDKIDQHSVIFPPEQQPDPVEVSDAVKTAIARSLRSTYANNLTTDEEESVRLQKQMLAEYSWALGNLSQLEVILIWHIATEYCEATSDDRSDDNGTIPNSNGRGVAVHLSTYCAYLIESVPELLPYHEADIAELAQEVMEEREELFKSCNGLPEIYNEMRSLAGRQEEDDPTTMFKKGVKLGKQLERKPDRWEVLQDFWAKKIIHFAASPHTTKQHMQQLENGGEFLTHIWALLAHAGILSLNRNRNRGQEGQTNPGSDPSAAV